MFGEHRRCGDRLDCCGRLGGGRHNCDWLGDHFSGGGQQRCLTARHGLLDILGHLGHIGGRDDRRCRAGLDLRHRLRILNARQRALVLGGHHDCRWLVLRHIVSVGSSGELLVRAVALGVVAARRLVAAGELPAIEAVSHDKERRDDDGYDGGDDNERDENDGNAACARGRASRRVNRPGRLQDIERAADIGRDQARRLARAVRRHVTRRVVGQHLAARIARQQYIRQDGRRCRLVEQQHSLGGVAAGHQAENRHK